MPAASSIGYSTAETNTVTPPVAKLARSATAACPAGEPIAAPSAASSPNHASKVR